MGYVERNGVFVWGEVEETAVSQMANCLQDDRAVAGRIMADGHLGYAVPIGGVIAYDEAVSPSGVGYDIACGNLAVRLDVPGEEVASHIETIMDDIYRTVSFGVGRKNAEEVDHDLFYNDPAWKIPAVAGLEALARSQLGTVGSGNHYVDVMLDELGRTWISIHFGSRGFGHKIATHYIKAGGGRDGMMVAPVVLPARSELGSEYLAAMALAGRYAYAGREWVADRVRRILGASVEEFVHVHHNYAWSEFHLLRQLHVVRKGATPLGPGERAYIGGSMGDAAYIVEGAPGDESVASLTSAPHGAGRVMSRTAAAGRRGRWGEARKGGLVSREMMGEWLAREGVTLRGGGTDESPHCYKRLSEVLAHHRNVWILHTLRPIGVAMAGGEYGEDPYRD